MTSPYHSGWNDGKNETFSVSIVTFLILQTWGHHASEYVAPRILDDDNACVCVLDAEPARLAMAPGGMSSRRVHCVGDQRIQTCSCGYYFNRNWE